MIGLVSSSCKTASGSLFQLSRRISVAVASCILRRNKPKPANNPQTLQPYALRPSLSLSCSEVEAVLQLPMDPDTIIDLVNFTTPLMYASETGFLLRN